MAKFMYLSLDLIYTINLAGNSDVQKKRMVLFIFLIYICNVNK